MTGKKHHVTGIVTEAEHPCKVGRPEFVEVSPAAMLTRRKTAGALSAIETGFPPIALQSHKELDVRNVVPGSEHKPGLGILLTPYFKLGKELFFNGHRPLLRVLRTPVRSFSSRHLHGLELDLSRLVHPVDVAPLQNG